MYRAVAPVCLLCAAFLVAAEGRSPGLSEQEIAAGWLLLFDGDSTFGWKTDGDAQVKDGALVLGGDRPTTVVSTTRFGDVELRFAYRVTGPKPAQVVLRRGQGGWGQELQPQPADVAGWSMGTLRWEGDRVSSSFQPAAGSIAPAQGSVSATGRTAVLFTVPAGTTLALRSVQLRPLGLESIFTGKDLSGWKEFPGRKSTFTVTPEGWLRIQNGPGDLQTTGAWGDFVLQLECRSNGQHLNSGVFFRCRPNEYQQGYEAQIRNQFTAEPTQEYTIDTYDPQTGTKVGAKKVKLQAVDYGTGAIYRRQPARRQASRDGAWFTLTVAADGRHLATWVNGVQVTDWTDQRPLSDNARNGCRLEKGPISLQGHDPTTDLSFRNFRIAELPAER